MGYRIAQLFLTPAHRTTNTSEVFVSQPDAYKENLAGKLFIIIEIESKRASDLKMVNFLINTLNHNYYQNEKIILRERLPDLKVEHIFESALAKTNKKLAEFLRTEKIKLNAKIINATIGVVYKNQIHFTNIGKNKALMISKQKTETSSKYSLTDITEQADGKGTARLATQNKLFSNVISGAMPINGYFIFTSETLPEYLSHRQLIDIITTLPPASAVEQIKNTLSKINAYIPFLGLIIKNTAGLEKTEAPSKTILPSTQASISSLKQTEENTEKLLSPTGIINFKDWLNILSGFTPRFNQKLKKSTDKNFLLKDKIFSKKRSSFFSFKKIINIIKIVFSYLVNSIIFIFKTLSDKQKLIDSKKNISFKTTQFVQSTKGNARNSIVWFKKLNKKNKALFAAALICLLLLMQNIIWISYKNQKIENANILNELTEKIEQKQNQVDASLLYNNEEGAKKIMEEAKLLLSEYPRDNKEQEEKYSRFMVKNQEQIDKISHVVKIESPEKISNFADLNSLANPDNIIMSSNTIYSSDSNLKTIYVVNLTDKLITAIANTNPTYAKITKPMADKNKNLFYLNTDKIIKLNTENEEFTPMTIEFDGNFSQITSHVLYNNRLYLLDSVNNKILRYNVGDNITSPISWLKDGADISEAVDLAIDGNIFILKKNGEIIKLLKGEVQEFTISSVEPTIEEAVKIEVSPEQKYIYVLEPKQKRLIIFDKSGKFLEQYVGDSFNNLKDFTVDEINKKIYFLDNTTVYSINAEYFEE